MQKQERHCVIPRDGSKPAAEVEAWHRAPPGCRAGATLRELGASCCPRPISGLTLNPIGSVNDQPSVRGFAVSLKGCTQGRKTTGGHTANTRKSPPSECRACAPARRSRCEGLRD